MAGIMHILQAPLDKTTTTRPSAALLVKTTRQVVAVLSGQLELVGLVLAGGDQVLTETTDRDHRHMIAPEPWTTGDGAWNGDL